mmetsp:Transcript_14545/g.31869  ORF Transcript_14545/g.31869 Transcript_14545/m.31869 type:complete len:371 (+) Transcript_14545:20-1132(+)
MGAQASQQNRGWDHSAGAGAASSKAALPVFPLPATAQQGNSSVSGDSLVQGLYLAQSTGSLQAADEDWGQDLGPPRPSRIQLDPFYRWRHGFDMRQPDAADPFALWRPQAQRPQQRLPLPSQQEGYERQAIEVQPTMQTEVVKEQLMAGPPLRRDYGRQMEAPDEQRRLLHEQEQNQWLPTVAPPSLPASGLNFPSTLDRSAANLSMQSMRRPPGGTAHSLLGSRQVSKQSASMRLAPGGTEQSLMGSRQVSGHSGSVRLAPGSTAHSLIGSRHVSGHSGSLRLPPGSMVHSTIGSRQVSKQSTRSGHVLPSSTGIRSGEYPSQVASGYPQHSPGPMSRPTSSRGGLQASPVGPESSQLRTGQSQSFMRS